MSECNPGRVKYESMILCPEGDAGYLTLHESVQEGWEPLVCWQDFWGAHIVLRRAIDGDRQ